MFRAVEFAHNAHLQGYVTGVYSLIVAIAQVGKIGSQYRETFFKGNVPHFAEREVLLKPKTRAEDELANRALRIVNAYRYQVICIGIFPCFLVGAG